jgi:hypothetical protein
MVLSDGDSIRKKIKKDYEQTQRKLEKARGDLDRFHKHDVPLFAQWLNGNFGSLLTAIREAGRRVAEAESLVFEIENEVFFTGVSHDTAYRRVMERRNKAAARDNDDEEDDDFDCDPFEFFEEILEGKEGAGPNPDAEARGGFKRGGKGRAAGGKKAKDGPKRSRLKELYRTLVRMLHPDSARELSEHQREIWHQVQAAYEAGDEEQLEVILALQEVEGKGHTDSTSLSLLQKITRRFKAALKEVQAQLRKLRKDPAWKFSERKDLAPLRRRFQGSLEDDVFRVQSALDHFESLLEEWKEESERSGRPRRAGRRRKTVFGDHPDFLF